MTRVSDWILRVDVDSGTFEFVPNSMMTEEERTHHQRSSENPGLTEAVARLERIARKGPVIFVLASNPLPDGSQARLCLGPASPLGRAIVLCLGSATEAVIQRAIGTMLRYEMEHEGEMNAVLDLLPDGTIRESTPAGTAVMPQLWNSFIADQDIMLERLQACAATAPIKYIPGWGEVRLATL